MKLKGAIFDLDGTLLDSMSVWEDVPNIYLKAKGIEGSETLGYEVSKMSLTDACKYIGKKYNISDANEKILSDILTIVSDFYKYEVPLKEGAAKFLRHLHINKVKMCVATATDKTLAIAALKRCGVYELFEDILTCTELNTDKQSAYIYEEALKITQSKKEDTVIFEDAYHAAKTAKSDGFFVCGVYDESEKNDVVSICDFYIKNFTKAGELFD